MPCYGPLTAYRPRIDSGDTRLVFKKSDSETGIALKLPCGKCPGCKLEHSRQWAVRCMHEKRLHNASMFLTLTYSDANLPSGGNLVPSDLTKFLKRLWHENNALRYFACGEYGEHTDRPHYHVLVLDQDLPDKRPIKSGSEYTLYESPTMSRLWPHGHTAIGDVTFESAAYVARYCMKKRQNGKTRTDGKTPEYIVMSRRPGLGTGYFQKYQNEIINHDTIIVNGLPAALPRFYDNKLAGLTGYSEQIGLYSKYELIKLKRRRKLTSPLSRADRSQRRLRIREVVTLAKLKLKAKTL
jgi:hypothetical protein